MKISYTYQRVDYVETSVAMIRLPWTRRLINLSFTYAIFIGTVLVVLVYRDAPGVTFTKIIAFMPWLAWVFMAAVTVCTLFAHRVIFAPVAALTYSKIAAAGSQVTIDLDVDAIRSSVLKPAIESFIAWDAINQLLETRHGLFLAISPREALALPRRAFETTLHYDTAKRLISAQTEKDWS